MYALYGETIRHTRENRNLTQSELAELAHVSRQTIATIENNSHDVKLSSLENVLNALGLALSIAPKPFQPLSKESEEPYEQFATLAIQNLFS